MNGEWCGVHGLSLVATSPDGFRAVCFCGHSTPLFRERVLALQDFFHEHVRRTA